MPVATIPLCEVLALPKQQLSLQNIRAGLEEMASSDSGKITAMEAIQHTSTSTMHKHSHTQVQTES